jgi:hypothetical protein
MNGCTYGRLLVPISDMQATSHKDQGGEHSQHVLESIMGYLAISPAVMSPAPDDESSRTRYWLSANSTALLQLVQGAEGIFISITASGVEYVRAALTHRVRGDARPRLAEQQPRLLSPQQTCSCWCLFRVCSAVCP